MAGEKTRVNKSGLKMKGAGVLQKINIENVTREQILEYYINQNYTVLKMCKMLDCKEVDFYKKNREFGIKKKALMKKIVRKKIESETDFILSRDERNYISKINNNIKDNILNYTQQILQTIEDMEYKNVIRDRDYRLPTEGGVYMFYDENKSLLYIGKAVNFWLRYRQHLKIVGYDNSSFNNTYHYSNEFKYFKFVPIKEKWMQDIIETSLIREMCPKYNEDKAYKESC